MLINIIKYVCVYSLNKCYFGSSSPEQMRKKHGDVLFQLKFQPYFLCPSSASWSRTPWSMNKAPHYVPVEGKETEV